MSNATSQPPKKKTSAKAKAPAAGALSKYQKFAVERVSRSLIKGAPYNPRTIDDWSAKKLREVLAKYGLVETLTWNKRTGNLVGGHQRLNAIDLLDAHDGGTGDYTLDMAVVDVTEKREKALNVILNNPSLQGAYDLEKLQDLIGPAGELSLDDVAFDPITAEEMFLGSDWEDDFRPAEIETVADAGEELRAMAAARKAEGKPDYAGAPVAADEDAPFGRTASGDAIRDPDAHAALKEERDRTRDKFQAMNQASDSEYYAIVVLGSREECDAFLVGVSGNADTKYVNGRALMDRLGIPLPKTEEAT